LVLRFVKGQFNPYQDSTIGAAFLAQTVPLDERTSIKFEIWDTAGQERYHSLAPMYYRKANCAIVVYDITQTASLVKAKRWIHELRTQAEPSIVIALCGNKKDLSDQRQVTEEEAKEYAEQEGLVWCETSAKCGLGVNEMFDVIAKRLPLPDEPLPARGVRGGAPGTSVQGVNLGKQSTAPGGEACNC